MIVLDAFVVALVTLMLAILRLSARALVVFSIALMITLLPLVIVPMALVIAFIAMMLAIIVRAIRAFAIMQLDVSASGAIAAEASSGRITIRQDNRKGVVPARFAVVRHLHHGSSGFTVDRHVVTDQPGVRVDHVISRHSRRLHVHLRAVVDVI
jgi:hypothetical protein